MWPPLIRGFEFKSTHKILLIRSFFLNFLYYNINIKNNSKLKVKKKKLIVILKGCDSEINLGL